MMSTNTSRRQQWLCQQSHSSSQWVCTCGRRSPGRRTARREAVEAQQHPRSLQHPSQQHPDAWTHMISVPHPCCFHTHLCGSLYRCGCAAQPAIPCWSWCMCYTLAHVGRCDACCVAICSLSKLLSAAAVCSSCHRGVSCRAVYSSDAVCQPVCVVVPSTPVAGRSRTDVCLASTCTPFGAAAPVAEVHA